MGREAHAVARQPPGERFEEAWHRHRGAHHVGRRGTAFTSFEAAEVAGQGEAQAERQCGGGQGQVVPPVEVLFGRFRTHRVEGASGHRKDLSLEPIHAVDAETQAQGLCEPVGKGATGVETHAPRERAQGVHEAREQGEVGEPRAAWRYEALDQPPYAGRPVDEVGGRQVAKHAVQPIGAGLIDMAAAGGHQGDHDGAGGSSGETDEPDSVLFESGDRSKVGDPQAASALEDEVGVAERLVFTHQIAGCRPGEKTDNGSP